MTTERPTIGLYDLPHEWHRGQRIMQGELRDRSIWFIKLRWFVPFGIAAGVLMASWLHVELSSPAAILVIAGFILLYNVVFFAFRQRLPEIIDREEQQTIRHFTRWQVGFDYISMFLLVHYTGGIASPLIFFFIFHIIFSSILLRPVASWGFAAMVVAGMTTVAVVEYLGWLPNHEIVISGRASDLYTQPYQIAVQLCFFAASVLITAAATTTIMTMLRKRIDNLMEMSHTVDLLNRKLNALFSMTQAIGSVRDLDDVLKIVTTELAQIIGVVGISVKLLDNNSRQLSLVAVHGVVPDARMNRTIDLNRSALSRRVIEGEAFAVWKAGDNESLQYADDMHEAGIRSALFVPLTVDDRSIGVLGAYCTEDDRFGSDEIEFFRLAASLVGIAIDNARSYQAIERLGKERSWFMMRVAHNLRAPLSAMASLLDVVVNEYQGPLNDDQKKSIGRIHHRAHDMISMINELLVLTRENEDIKEVRESVDLRELGKRVERTFAEEANQKSIALIVNECEGKPRALGDPEALLQVLENLVSNAIKYTPSGGRIEITFSEPGADQVRIEVGDNGIGIAPEALENVFDEFYRADNARKLDEVGTGLGLPIVKKVVERHGGEIHVTSESGQGSKFTVNLPSSKSEAPESLQQS